jgi:hypothetical protein
MKLKIPASISAIAGACALLAGPVVAAPHFGGGGAHFSGGHAGAHFSGGHFSGGHFSGGHFSGARFGGTRGAWAGGGWRGGGWRGGFDHHQFFGFFPFFAFYDPFFWDVGFVGGYDIVPYWDDYYDDYDDPADAYGPPPPAGAAAPPGYNCDGWRWDASQQRYLPAKVACQ